MNYRIKQNKTFHLEDLIAYVFLISCILSCNTVYSASKNINFMISEFTILFLFIYLLLNVRWLKISLLKKWISIFVPYYLLNFLIVLASVSSGALYNYILHFLLFVPLLTLILMNDSVHEKVWNLFLKFENLVLLYAIVSLIFWVLITFFNLIPKTGTLLVSWGGLKTYPLYFGIFTTYQTENFLGVEWIRNLGVFTEGPMYNLILLLAICIELFVVPIYENQSNNKLKDINFMKLGILISTDLTTFTTTGMIVIAMMLAFKYCLLKNKSALANLLKWFGAIFVIIVALLVIYFLFSQKSSSGSWAVRYDDIVAGFKAWKDHIVIGNRYSDVKPIQNYMSSFRFNNMGYSSGLFSILAQGGLLLMSLYALSFYGYIKFSIYKHKNEIFAMMFSIFVILIQTIFQDTFIMMIILSYGYVLLSLSIKKSILD